MIHAGMPPRGSKVIIIARFSHRDANPLSAEDQIAMCREECERLGWVVVAVFKDEAKSGRRADNRAGYIAAMDLAAQGEIEVIVATALDRIGRHARELHDAKNRLSDSNVKIYTLRQKIMNRFEFAIYAEMAQMESERLGERTGAGQRNAARRGNIMGDLAYGYRATYDKDGRREVEIDPITSAIVLRINRDYAAGLSPIKIARKLTEEGVPTPEGKPVWSPNTILGTRRSGNGLLRNPLYIGRYIHGKTTVTRDSKTGKPIKKMAGAENRVEVEVPHLRILPDELWLEVQEILDGRAARPSARESRRPEYLLSGLTKCGMCGGAFAMTTDRLGCVNRRVGACTNARRVDRQRLERLVLDGLRNRIVRSPVIDFFLPEYLKELDEARRESSGSKVARELRLREVELEIENLLKQARAGATGFALQLLNENLNMLGAERERLKRRASTPPPEETALRTPDEVVARLRLLMDEFAVALDSSDRDAAFARDAIRSMITRIEVMPIGKPTGRGGSVTVSVEGPMAALVAPAVLGKQTLRVRGIADRQSLSLPAYRFHSILDQEPSARDLRLEHDVAVVTRIIRQSDSPVPIRELVAELSQTTEFASLRSENHQKRAEAALRLLKRDGLAATNRRGSHAGWEWKGP